MTTPPVAQSLRYDHGLGRDSGRYDLSDGTRRFEGDPVSHASAADLNGLATSPHWEDRLRAEALRRSVTITLPDGFPCLYERPDSPRQEGLLHKRPHPWVLSPDLDMLTELLPIYQQLWDYRTAEWGPRSRHLFAVGRLDGLQAGGVYRPGATVETVIGSTMITHHDLYKCAPEWLKRMHPLHEQWTARTSRAATK